MKNSGDAPSSVDQFTYDNLEYYLEDTGLSMEMAVVEAAFKELDMYVYGSECSQRKPNSDTSPHSCLQ